jgi:cytochrome bd-type quinol oxidase subunit 2
VANIQSGHIIPVGEDPAKVSRWCGMAVASLVVLGASVVTFQSASCRTGTDEDQDGSNEMHEEFCRRTTFAIALGLISMLMSAAMTYLLLKQQPSGRALSLRAEMSIATLQLLLWCFGVSFVTFGKGPGSTIGNLYLSTWITFILAVVIFAVSFRECVASRAAKAAAVVVATTAQDHNGSSSQVANVETSAEP